MNCANCSTPSRNGVRGQQRHENMFKLVRTGNVNRDRYGHDEEQWRCPGCGARFWFPKFGPQLAIA